MEYSQAVKEEEEELLAFINDVFKEDFSSIMRKVYGSGEQNNTVHHLIKEQGKIVAAVGVYEQDFHIQDIVLKTGFIGSVSVSTEARQKGYMKFLIKKAEEDMRNKEIALAMLNGRRNRYGFFGYEIAGECMEFLFEEENIRHTIGWEADPSVKFEQITSDKDPALDAIYDLYRTSRLWCRNREDFYQRSVTWDRELYQIQVDRNFVGYLICEKKHQKIEEWGVYDYSVLMRVLRAYLTEYQKEDHKKVLLVKAHLWELEKALALQRNCENYQIRPDVSYKILDYKKALPAMLSLKRSYAKMEDGTFVLKILGQESFEIKIQNDDITVENAGEKRADLALDEREMISALLSPASKLYETQSRSGYPKGWFPLGFGVETADEF